MELADDLQLALRLADLADALTMAGRSKSARWTKKSDGSPVSDIDRAVETALSAEISAARPDDLVFGEEMAAEHFGIPLMTPNTRQWVLDPIDQTRHYLRGNPEFATLISLNVGGVALVGVVSAPALGQRWWASRRGGAWKNRQRIGVSAVTKLEEAHIAIAGHREWHSQWDWDKVAQLLGRCAYPAGCPGGFLQPMLIADGSTDIFIEPWGELWDHAAPSVIVTEAGGTVTTLTGGPPQGGSLLATNGFLHSEVLQYFTSKA